MKCLTHAVCSVNQGDQSSPCWGFLNADEAARIGRFESDEEQKLVGYVIFSQ